MSLFLVFLSMPSKHASPEGSGTALSVRQRINTSGDRRTKKPCKSLMVDESQTHANRLMLVTFLLSKQAVMGQLVIWHC